MPTTNFSYTDSHIVLGGEFDSAGTVAGIAAHFFSGHGDEIRFKPTGTDLSMHIYPQGTQQIDIIFNGVTSTPTMTANTWQTVPIFSGQLDISHEVTIKGRNGSSGGIAPVIDDTNSFALTGSSPTLSLPTGFNSNSIAVVGNSSYIQSDGSQGASVTTESNTNTFAGSSAGGSHTGHGYIRFHGKTQNVNYWFYNGGDKVTLVVDDNLAGATKITTPSSGTWSWVNFSGLDNTTEHQYMLLNSKLGSAGSCYSYSVNIDSFDTSTISARSLWAFYGDSITTNTSTDYDQGFPEIFTITEKYGSYVCGIAGTCVQNSLSGSSAGESRTADLTGLSIKPTHVVILYGVNDANNGSSTVAGFQTSYYNMVSNLLSGLGTSVKIICLGILPTSSSPANSLRSSYNSAIQSSIGSGGNGSGSTLTTAQQAQCQYVDTTGWIVPASDTVDGTHPNTTGMSKIAAQLEALFPNGGVQILFRRNLFNRIGSRGEQI